MMTTMTCHDDYNDILLMTTTSTMLMSKHQLKLCCASVFMQQILDILPSSSIEEGLMLTLISVVLITYTFPSSLVRLTPPVQVGRLNASLILRLPPRRSSKALVFFSCLLALPQLARHISTSHIFSQSHLHSVAQYQYQYQCLY